MIYKEITLRADLPEQVSTEIMFEIASARADSTELLCINIFNEDKSYDFQKKHRAAVIKGLKALKGEGKIQLYATSDSFLEKKTEAYFLQNKYPYIFTNEYACDENKIYVKI
ncbi:MAG: hypothetical protein E7678_05015 [Ruminococcaceae bacterium]|nr:hypothetical protein [Oscillospiraceae bacterium]